MIAFEALRFKKGSGCAFRVAASRLRQQRAMPAIRSLFCGIAGIKGLVLSSSLREPPQKGAAAQCYIFLKKPQKALKPALFLVRNRTADSTQETLRFPNHSATHK